MDSDLLKKVIQKIVKEEVQQSVVPIVSKIIKESVKEEIKNILYEQFTSGKQNIINTQPVQQQNSQFSLQDLMSDDYQPPFQQQVNPYQAQVVPMKPINTGNAGINNILNEMKTNGYAHIPSENAASPIMDYMGGANMAALYASQAGIDPNSQMFAGAAGKGYLKKPDPDEVMISPKSRSLPPGLAKSKIQQAMTRDYSAFLK